MSGLFRKEVEPYVRKIAVYFSGLSPNTITFISLVIAIVAAYFFSKQDWFVGGMFALLAAFLDAIDGAVARIRRKETKKGAYLDAVMDRYVEGVLLFGIGMGTGLWHLVFLAMWGAILIPYTKARASMEKKIDNINWPDLMERAERLVFISIIFPIAAFFGYAELALVVMVILFHLTAIQRIRRALKMLG